MKKKARGLIVITRVELLQKNVRYTMELGFSYKVPKAPFRLVANFDQILNWNLKYVSPVDTAGKTNPFTANEAPPDSTGWQKFTKRFGNRADNFMRHIVIGTEIVITKNFMLRVAYNHRRQREMILPERRGANGLSLGFGPAVRHGVKLGCAPLRGKRHVVARAGTQSGPMATSSVTVLKIRFTALPEVTDPAQSSRYQARSPVRTDLRTPSGAAS